MKLWAQTQAQAQAQAQAQVQVKLRLRAHRMPVARSYIPAPEERVWKYRSKIADAPVVELPIIRSVIGWSIVAPCM